MTLVRRSFILSLLFGIWAWFAEITGLITWAGAAGCTTYFACCGCGQDAGKGIWSNLSGIFWARYNWPVESMKDVAQIIQLISEETVNVRKLMAMLNGLPQKKIQFTFDEGVRRSFGKYL